MQFTKLLLHLLRIYWLINETLPINLSLMLNAIVVCKNTDSRVINLVAAPVYEMLMGNSSPGEYHSADIGQYINVMNVSYFVTFHDFPTLMLLFRSC